VLHDDLPKRSSDIVKCPVPRLCRAEPKTPRDVPATKVARGAGNARGAGTRIVRLGGRHRLDASCVFSPDTGRSQDLWVRREGASQEKVRSTA
jgi:hypothetical protein